MLGRRRPASRSVGPAIVVAVVLALTTALLTSASTSARATSDEPGSAFVIEGKVADESGRPLQGIHVSLHDSYGSDRSGPLVTGADGRWSFDFFERRTVRVMATDPSGVYARTVWRDEIYPEDGDEVVVDGRGEPETVDLQMGPASTISGTVARASGEPWGSLEPRVTVWRAQGSSFEYWPGPRPGTFSYPVDPATGRYVVAGLPRGTYRLAFSAPRHVTAYWRNGTSEHDATDVVLGQGENQRGVDSRLILAGGISGRVTDQAGRPLGGVSISAVAIVGTLLQSTTGRVQYTEPDGTYELRGLDPAVYQVAMGIVDVNRRYLGHWWPDGGGDQSRAVMIEVEHGRPVTGIDAQLERPAVIEGTYTSSDGSSSGPVSLLYRDGDRWTLWDSRTARPDYGESVATFEFAGLPPGAYRLCTRYGDVTSGCWPAGRYVEESASIVVGHGDVVRRAVVDPGITEVAGTLTGPSDEESAHRKVEAWARVAGTWRVVATTYPDRAGAWSMTLPVGSYRLRGFVDGREAWWRDGDDMLSADELVVRPNEPRTGIAIDVVGGWSLSGSVSMTDGGTVPASGPDVVVHRRDATGEWRRIASTYGDEDWTIDGLRDGTYRLEYTNYRGGTVRQFWPDSDTFAGAEDIVVSGGDVDGLDIELVRAGRIDGVRIRARDRRGVSVPWTVYTQRDGRWQVVEGLRPVQFGFGILGVPPGTVRLGFEDPEKPWFAPEFWSEARSVETATDIEVEPGGRVSDIVATFDLQTHPVAAPRLLDRPGVGVAVRGFSGVWSPLGTAVRRQWLLDGQPIAGATGATYTPRPQDRGRALSLRVVGVRPGFVTGVADSAAAVVGAGAVRLLQRPRVVGSPDVGGTLRLAGGRWSPGEVRLTHRWLVGQRAVSRSARLRLRPAHAGRPVRVLVTASAPGLAPSTTTVRMRGRVGR